MMSVDKIKPRPRLVPRPLWWLSLARLARIDPYVLDLIDYSRYDVLERWHKIWFDRIRENIAKGVKCEICNKNTAKYVDEIWEYDILGDKGIAKLVGLQIICDYCNLVIHYGYATVRGESARAFKWFMEINKLSVDEAKKIINDAFEAWRNQSRISKWTFSLDYIANLYPDLEAELEFILNRLYMLTFEGFRFDRGYIRFIRNDTSGNSDTLIRLGEHPSDLVEKIIRKCEACNLSYDERSMVVAVYLTYLDAILRSTLILIKLKRALGVSYNKDYVKEVIISLKRLKEILANRTLYTDPNRLKDIYNTISEKVFSISNAFRAYLSGKWMFFLRSYEAFKIFKRIANAMKEGKLASSSAKISIDRSSEYRQVICVYVDDFTEVDRIARLRDQLVKLGINAYLMFKPDIFTAYGIYRRTTDMRPYIYWSY